MRTKRKGDHDHILSEPRLAMSISFQGNESDKLHGENLPHQGNVIPANIKHDIKIPQLSKCNNLLLLYKEQKAIG